MESENVKEKLNSMIHKKLSDQQQHEHKEIKEEAIDCTEVRVKQENECLYPGEGAAAFVDEAPGSQAEERFQHVSLQEILNEKKKALLQNKEIIDFLSARIKPS